MKQLGVFWLKGDLVFKVIYLIIQLFIKISLGIYMTTDYIKVLNYCIERQEKIKIDYVNNYGRKSTRTIQPIGIREERDLYL